MCCRGGCVDSLHRLDPHTQCVLHSPCTQAFVFNPCKLCHVLYARIVADIYSLQLFNLSSEAATPWKDIFMFRFEKFKRYREMSGHPFDILYVNSLVERQFEVFDSSIGLQENALKNKLQQWGIGSKFLHEAKTKVISFKVPFTVFQHQPLYVSAK